MYGTCVDKHVEVSASRIPHSLNFDLNSISPSLDLVCQWKSNPTSFLYSFQIISFSTNPEVLAARDLLQSLLRPTTTEEMSRSYILNAIEECICKLDSLCGLYGLFERNKSSTPSLHSLPLGSDP
jgi:hypothetical protein